MCVSLILIFPGIRSHFFHSKSSSNNDLEIRFNDTTLCNIPSNIIFIVIGVTLFLGSGYGASINKQNNIPQTYSQLRTVTLQDTTFKPGCNIRITKIIHEIPSDSNGGISGSFTASNDTKSVRVELIAGGLKKPISAYHTITNDNKLVFKQDFLTDSIKVLNNRSQDTNNNDASPSKIKPQIKKGIPEIDIPSDRPRESGWEGKL